MIELTHNTWIDPARVDVVRFAAAYQPGKKTDLEDMELQVWIGVNCLVERRFSSHNDRAWKVASDRMHELVQLVHDAHAPAEAV